MYDPFWYRSATLLVRSRSKSRRWSKAARFSLSVADSVKADASTTSRSAGAGVMTGGSILTRRGGLADPPVDAFRRVPVDVLRRVPVPVEGLVLVGRGDAFRALPLGDGRLRAATVMAMATL